MVLCFGYENGDVEFYDVFSGRKTINFNLADSIINILAFQDDEGIIFTTKEKIIYYTT